MVNICIQIKNTVVTAQLRTIVKLVLIIILVKLVMVINNHLVLIINVNPVVARLINTRTVTDAKIVQFYAVLVTMVQPAPLA